MKDESDKKTPKKADNDKKDDSAEVKKDNNEEK